MGKIRNNTKKCKQVKFGYTILFEVFFGAYFLILALEPLLYRPTAGITYGYRTETKDYSIIHNSRSKGTYASNGSITSYILDYAYTVDNKEYKSSHVSNMIIYPEPIETQGAITIYYNRLIPAFSVVSPVTIPYFIINNTLFIITSFVLGIKLYKRKKVEGK